MESIGLLAGGKPPKRILALGAHSDDIEIGCGGTMLRLAAERPQLDVLWVVFAATPERAAEARASACAFLEGVATKKVIVRDYRDGFLPFSGAAVKDEFETLTWNTWRDHLILEYEIPKYDGDFGSPNFFGVLPASALDCKIELLERHFPSQATKPWFTADLFRAVARIRGMECAAPGGFAEGFYVRKARF